jgi:iron complex outermembrane receptor protein
MNYVLCDYIYRGEHDFENGRDDRKEFNPRIGWRNGNWNLSIWGKNLTDDEYASMIYNAQKCSGKQAHLLAPPRTYGVDVRYNF